MTDDFDELAKSELPTFHGMAIVTDDRVPPGMVLMANDALDPIVEEILQMLSGRPRLRLVE